jgi:tetratricopeptide (TPR) repeat protein
VNKRILLGATGLVLVATLFFFGQTVAKKNKALATTSKNVAHSFDIAHYISDAKQKLTPNQILTLGKIENSVTRGDVVAQQIIANNKLANFWKDSVRQFEPYVYYLSEAAKLDNSEKNLTFAAQLILDNLRGEQNEDILNWKAEQAIELFESAIKLNPSNDDLKIGLGSCYIFGKGRSGNPQQTMAGIQQLLAVLRNDSTNMKAQMVLGIGGFTSGQYDKAIDRLTKVVKAQPENFEAMAYLADAYAAKGDKVTALSWYKILKKVTTLPEYRNEIEERIKLLQ